LTHKNEIRVLIVDDDKSSLDILEEYLVAEGFSVLTASDGSKAIKIIEEEDLDVVLTDLKLPGANGIEVLKVAKKVNQDLHVIIITGYASLETALQAIKEGGYDYITKPFRLEEVGVALKNVSGKVTLEREKRSLAKDLRKAYTELDILKESKMNLKNNLNSINKRIEEGRARIVKNLETLQTLPGTLLPLHYVQTKGKGDDEILVRLERLGKLRDEGVLTEEEFRVNKERFLTKI